MNEMIKVKELHLQLELKLMNNEGWANVYKTYTETERAIERGDDVVYTTQTHFLSFRYAERLFVYVNGTEHEITLGKCSGTTREIKESHNLEKLLLNGEFDWFRTIPEPYVDGYCEKCVYHNDEMCCKHRLGMSWGYCPQIKDCTTFLEKKHKKSEKGE